MKYRILDYIRCPNCLSRLHLLRAVNGNKDSNIDFAFNPCKTYCAYAETLSRASFLFCKECIDLEIHSGSLKCNTCASVYMIKNSIPRLICASRLSRKTDMTRRSFSYLWKFDREEYAADDNRKDGRESFYHLDKVMKHVKVDNNYPRLWLDAGCGNGHDLMILNKVYKNIEAIGIDIADAGVQNTYQRTSKLPFTYVIQASLEQLPFDKETFDFVYCYGVLHHTVTPKDNLRNLVTVLKPDGLISVYLYEDFSDRTKFESLIFRSVNSIRRITTRMPHFLLFLLCILSAPFIYLFLTLPANALSSFSKTKNIAKRIPYHHCISIWEAVTDLFDRLSAPIEYRYNPGKIIQLFKSAGIKRKLNFIKDRGWIVWTPKNEY